MPKPVKKAASRKRSTPKRPSSDPILRARQMFDEHMAKAETPETPPAPSSFQEQFSAHMAKLGAKGGKIGGKRRMDTMTFEQRSAIGLKAVRARWTDTTRTTNGATAPRRASVRYRP